MDWPDDLAVAIRRREIASALALGVAMCVACGKDHEECGRLHLEKPWSIAPRCTDCGEILRLPELQQAA